MNESSSVSIEQTYQNIQLKQSRLDSKSRDYSLLKQTFDEISQIYKEIKKDPSPAGKLKNSVEIGKFEENADFYLSVWKRSQGNMRFLKM